MKISKTITVLLLGIALFLSGCSFLVPEEYKDGVKIDRHYPEDYLPVYEDAIVFSSQEDDDEITLLMGTDDDIDDIIDFYQDFFEDEGIILSDEDEGKNDYYAEGHIPEYDFELTAEEPKGKWEEKLFANVIEIVVIPAEDPVEATQNTLRPDNTTSPNNPAVSGGYAPQLDELYGAWVEYFGENSFALWADGTGRQWDYTYEFGWDITWQYDQGWLSIQYGDSTVDRYSVTYVGQDIYIENSELEIYQYMQRADSWITNTPWRLTYDSGYEITEPFFSYFYDDGTYTLYAADHTTEVASYYWSFTYENDIEMYDDTTSYLYHYSYEGGMLIMRTEDWTIYYEFTRAN